MGGHVGAGIGEEGLGVEGESWGAGRLGPHSGGQRWQWEEDPEALGGKGVQGARGPGGRLTSPGLWPDSCVPRKALGLGSREGRGAEGVGWIPICLFS